MRIDDALQVIRQALSKAQFNKNKQWTLNERAAVSAVAIYVDRFLRLPSKMVYIACPYTKGDVAINVKKCFEAADQLLNLGFIPYPPLYSHYWHILSPKPYDVWMEIDFAIILRCDCILRIPGSSKGADAEVEFAIKNRIPVFYNTYDLTEYWNDGKDTESFPAK